MTLFVDPSQKWIFISIEKIGIFLRRCFGKILKTTFQIAIVLCTCTSTYVDGTKFILLIGPL